MNLQTSKCERVVEFLLFSYKRFCLDGDHPGQIPPVGNPPWTETPPEGTWDQTGSDITQPLVLTSSGDHFYLLYFKKWFIQRKVERDFTIKDVSRGGSRISPGGVGQLQR